MRLFLITLAFIVGLLFANICSLSVVLLTYNSKNCYSNGNVLLVYAVLTLLLTILAPFLYWRFSANGTEVVRIILTIAIGFGQIVIDAVLIFGLVIAFNC